MSDYEPIDTALTLSYKSGDVVDKHEYFSYVAANDGRTYDPKYIGSGSSNKWIYQSFFTIPPEIPEDSLYSTYYTNITESIYKVSFPELDSSQGDIFFDNYEPEDNDSYDEIQFTIGQNVGPLTIGTGINVFPAVTLNENDSKYATWEMDHGISGRDPPTDQEDGIGVSFRMNASSNLSGNTYEIKFEDEQAYDVRQVFNGTNSVIYSTVADNTMFYDLDIV